MVLPTPCFQAQTAAFQFYGNEFLVKNGAQDFLQKAEPQSPLVNFLRLANS